NLQSAIRNSDGGLPVIRFQCPGCRSVMQVSEQLAGAVVGCSHCKQNLRVPAAPKPRGNPPPVPSLLPPVQQRPAEPRSPALRRQRENPPFDSFRSDRRRTRPCPPQSHVGLIVFLIVGSIVVLAAGAGAFFAWDLFRPAKA